jgi:uncharacterized protein
MFKRLCNPLINNSFFLFGARGTGKSTLLKQLISERNALWIDLLKPEVETLVSESPRYLSDQLDAMPTPPKWVVIDEVQKVPKLLDVVHYEIEKRKILFALTGSSARKLKKGASNLLAGRALLNNLYPLTYRELDTTFNILDAMAWGTLPFVVNSTDIEVRHSFLQTYVETYLKEEVLQEQLVRNVTPFRKFLAIASQCSGTLLNYNHLAREIKVDWTTIRTYFEILEDTLIGYFIPPYDKSVRRQQLKSSKFYLFDTGVKRALDKTLKVLPLSSQMIGPLFEHLVIGEIWRLNHYKRADYSLSYLATQGGLEVDLVVERPGQKTALIEIKSSDSIKDMHLRHVDVLVNENESFEAFCFCREPYMRKVGKVIVTPWQEGIKMLGL